MYIEKKRKILKIAVRHVFIVTIKHPLTSYRQIKWYRKPCSATPTTIGSTGKTGVVKKT